jgi:ferredoxin-fold anticodon binding domain-containing protein
MDIQKEYEKDLVFQIKSANKKDSKVKTKKIMKIAEENLRKIIKLKLNKQAGEC